MYIQPCCIHRELPQLMRGTARCYFQSNGDWTLQDLMKAISCLVPSCEAVVCMPVVDVYLLRTLRTYLAKGWYTGVTLLTRDDQSALVAAEVKDERLHYAHHAQVSDGLFALSDGTDHLAVIGALLLDKDGLLHHYAAYFGRDRETYKEITGAVLARSKSKRKTHPNPPCEGGDSESTHK